jgi:hypothetical protein
VAAAPRRARWRVLLLAALALLPRAAAAEAELRTLVRAEEVEERAELGAVVVEGVGAVTVVAERRGEKIVLRAGAADGTSLGKAEAPVGLARAPLFVKTPDGLEKIVVVWGAGRPGAP